ncbi:MAG: hypothetical protein AW09_000321 [Candidatus Accumulibacter phosphatis]|uniref:Uncharacterized protein n=1 Tax=Candidatus Accumulibacter phosphatis TaxID=327160 RepID=A0A080LZV0_9PROT|nr:MAG: hypothetical protein AW09_000321 [Candidatus Accumulibacter phosphatis]
MLDKPVKSSCTKNCVVESAWVVWIRWATVRSTQQPAWYSSPPMISTGVELINE